MPEYKEINNRVNVATNNPASQQVDKHFVAKGPEVNRFITQNKVNHHFITTQTHLQETVRQWIMSSTCNIKGFINKHFIVPNHQNGLDVHSIHLNL